MHYGVPCVRHALHVTIIQLGIQPVNGKWHIKTQGTCWNHSRTEGGGNVFMWPLLRDPTCMPSVEKHLALYFLVSHILLEYLD